MNQRIDLAKVAARNSLTVILCCIIGASLGLYLSFVLPKRYKSQAKLSIQASYFQNPIVDNLVAPVTDPAELQGQRIALIQRALDDEYIGKLAEMLGTTKPEPSLLRRIYLKLGLIERPTPDQEKAEALDAVNQRIELFPESSTSFLISFSAASQSLAQTINTEMVNQVQKVLFDERREALSSTKASLERRAKSLGSMLESAPEPQMQAEIKQTQAELSGLLLRFSPLHPKVVAEKDKLNKLQRQLPADTSKGGETLTNSEQAPTRMVFEELVKKLNYLSVVLDMESAKTNKGYVKLVEPPTFPLEATFPKKSIFFMFGSIAGLLVGSMIAFFVEQFRRNRISAYDASMQLGAPLLSELPELKLGHDALADHSKSSVPVLRLPSQ